MSAVSLVIKKGVILLGLWGIFELAHGRETVFNQYSMRWDRGILNGSNGD